MEHRVAIGTYRTKVLCRIDLILSVEFREQLEMMNMNEPGPNLAIALAEIHITHEATRAKLANAGRSRSFTALARIDRYFLGSTLRELIWLSYLLRVIGARLKRYGIVNFRLNDGAAMLCDPPPSIVFVVVRMQVPLCHRYLIYKVAQAILALYRQREPRRREKSLFNSFIDIANVCAPAQSHDFLQSD